MYCCDTTTRRLTPLESAINSIVGIAAWNNFSLEAHQLLTMVSTCDQRDREDRIRELIENEYIISEARKHNAEEILLKQFAILRRILDETQDTPNGP